MRGRIRVGFLAGILLTPSLAWATVAVSFVKAGTALTSDTVNPGPGAESYQLDLRMNSTSPLGAWDGGLQASTPGAIALTQVTPVAPWTSSDWDWATLYGVPQTGPLDPVSNSLGRMKPDLPDYPAGNYTVLTVTLDLSTTPNGVYTLTLAPTTNHGVTSAYRYWSNSSMSNPPSRDFDSIAPFTLTIVPEPATILLLAGGLALLRRRK